MTSARCRLAIVVTTENPRVIRITKGKMAAINFGTTLMRTARLELADAAFVAGTHQLQVEWLAKIGPIVAALQQEKTALRLTYQRDASEDVSLAQARLKVVETVIRGAWDQAGAPYRLMIDGTVMFARPTGSIERPRAKSPVPHTVAPPKSKAVSAKPPAPRETKQPPTIN